MSRSESESERLVAGVPLVAETGMPVMSDAKRAAGYRFAVLFLTVGTVLLRLVALGFAYVIYKLQHADYDLRLSSLRTLGHVAASGAGAAGNGPFKLGWLYLAAGLFSLMVSLMNTIPILWKNQVMPGNGGNLRSTMLIYKVNFVDREQRLPYAILEEEGEIGKFNRSNRALHHFVENGMSVVLNIVLAGLVFSEPVFFLVSLYVVARLWYQLAYTFGGYGHHLVPFIAHTVVLAPIIELLVWFTGVKLLLP